MGGYASRTGGAAGTHDPLYATVLVLEGAGTSLALVTCDLRSFVSTRVGELAKQRFGIAYTIISASHTHFGPLTWEARTPWYSEAEDKMVEAAVGGGYGADYNTVVAVGTGEMLVDRGVARLFELRGMLKDLPEARF